MDDSRAHGSHFHSIQCDAGGYSSMQIRKFSPFIQIPRTPLHHTPSIRLMDAAPLGVRGGRGREEASVKEMQGGWLVWRSLGRRGMAPNVRPDREIQHTSDAISTLFSIFCWRHFRMLSPLPCFIAP